jgi:hypothetical protein
MDITMSETGDVPAVDITKQHIYNAKFVLLALRIAIEIGGKLPSLSDIEYLNVLANLFGNKCNSGCLQLNTFACPRLDISEDQRKALCEEIKNTCTSPCLTGSVPLVVAHPSVMSFGNQVATKLANFTAPYQQQQATPWSPVVSAPPFPMASTSASFGMPQPAKPVLYNMAQPGCGVIPPASFNMGYI